MKKLLILVFAVILVSLVFAFQVKALFPGEYQVFAYGQAFRLQEFVSDSNGALDVDFSSTCTITGKYEPTNALVLDHNVMLNDPTIDALYYIIIDANVTELWGRGKYSSVMTCQDSSNDLNGSVEINWLIDQNVSQYFGDLNNTILDINSTTLDQILRTVSDINIFVTPEFLSDSYAFDDDLNLYSDADLTTLAHGFSFQPGTVLYYRGTASTGTIPNTTTFSSVATVFCTSSEICFVAEQPSPPLVLDGNLTGSVSVPHIGVGDYNLFLVVSGDDDTGTNVTVNGSTPAITIEKFVAGQEVRAGTTREEWQKLIDEGEIKLTQQIIDAGLATETQIDFFEATRPDAFSLFLLTPTKESNFVPPALWLGLVLLGVASGLSQTRFQVVGLMVFVLAFGLLALPFL